MHQDINTLSKKIAGLAILSPAGRREIRACAGR